MSECEFEHGWPEVFTNPDFVYVGLDVKAKAIADGLTGWGNCMAGVEPPKSGNFGKAMVKITKIIGIAATPDNLDSLADEFLAQPSSTSVTPIK